MLEFVHKMDAELCIRLKYIQLQDNALRSKMLDKPGFNLKTFDCMRNINHAAQFSRAKS